MVQFENLLDAERVVHQCNPSLIRVSESSAPNSSEASSQLRFLVVVVVVVGRLDGALSWSVLIAAARDFGYLVSMAKETSDPSPMVKRLL